MVKVVPTATLLGGSVVTTSCVAPRVTLKGWVVVEVRPVAVAVIVTPCAALLRVRPEKTATPLFTVAVKCSLERIAARVVLQGDRHRAVVVNVQVSLAILDRDREAEALTGGDADEEAASSRRAGWESRLGKRDDSDEVRVAGESGGGKPDIPIFPGSNPLGIGVGNWVFGDHSGRRNRTDVPREIRTESIRSGIIEPEVSVRPDDDLLGPVTHSPAHTNGSWSRSMD